MLPRSSFGRLAPLAAVFAACAGGDLGPASVARDSAGVLIVENRRPAWRHGEEWKLSAAPEVSIPGDAADYQFFRTWLGTRLSDGRIVLGNRAGTELMFFLGDGRFEGKVGREGAGPGEFEDLTALYRGAGDTLYAFDWSLGRIALFDATGSLIRSLKVMAPDGRSVEIEGRFGDGAFLFRTIPLWERPAEVGLARDSALFYLADRNGEIQRELGWFPARDVFAVPTRNGELGMTAYPFSRVPAIHVRGDAFVFGYGRTHQFRIHGEEGLERIVRWPGEPRPVTETDRAAYLAWRIGRDHRLGFGPELARSRVALMGFPDRMPAFADLLVDDLGYIWVDDYAPITDPDHATTWRVFDPDGTYLGDVSFPPRLRAIEIGRDYVLGRVADDLDVETIVVYGLRR